jgi:hypothetical protein
MPDPASPAVPAPNPSNPIEICKAEADALSSRPIREGYPPGADGDAQYAKAKKDVVDCFSRLTSCKYTEGVFDIVIPQLTSVNFKFRGLKKIPPSDRRVSDEDLDMLERAFQSFFWRAITICERNLAESVGRSLRSCNDKELSDIAKAMKTQNAANDAPENSPAFAHIPKEKRAVLVFLLELNTGEDDILKLFPKP